MKPATAPTTSDATVIDELMDIYLGWKEACIEVQSAYRRWSYAMHEDRALAYVAYSAALDREACAAARYRSQAARASRLWGDPGSLTVSL